MLGFNNYNNDITMKTHKLIIFLNIYLKSSGQVNKVNFPMQSWVCIVL